MDAIQVGDERRLKLLRVGQHQVLDHWLTMGGHLPGYVTVPKVEGIPPDVRLVAVHHSYESQTFDFTVEHPSFVVVPPGDRIPEFGPTAVWFQSVRVVSPQPAVIGVDWSSGTDRSPVMAMDWSIPERYRDVKIVVEDTTNGRHEAGTFCACPTPDLMAAGCRCGATAKAQP